MKTALGKDLEFISSINRNGDGTTPVDKIDMSQLDRTVFNMTCLSITCGTWIASGFNCYVVKMKSKK